jgi:hypothetical protein
MYRSTFYEYLNIFHVRYAPDSKPCRHNLPRINIKAKAKLQRNMQQVRDDILDVIVSYYKVILVSASWTSYADKSLDILA